jgi:branched-chain amino acid transport system permease protein
VAVYLVDQLVFKAIMPSGHQLVLGLLLVAMVMFSPDGLFSVACKLSGRHHAAA